MIGLVINLNVTDLKLLSLAQRRKDAKKRRKININVSFIHL